MRTSQDFYGVREQMGDGFEGLYCPFRTAGQIDDDGVGPEGGNAAGKNCQWRLFKTFAANLLGQTGYGSVGNIESSLGSGVARAKSGSTGGQKDIDLAGVSDCADLTPDVSRIV